MERALASLKATGDSRSAEVPLFDFQEFCGRIGFQEVWDFERRWAR